MKRLSVLMKGLGKENLVLKTYQTGNGTENPGKNTRDMVKIPRDDEEEDRHLYDFNRLSQLPPKPEILKFFSKIAIKIKKTSFMSDFFETFPMDFLGAAQSEGALAIICISSDEDEEMDSFDGDSVDDVYVSSEEEMLYIEIMARCIERQMAEPIAVANAETTGTQARSGTPKPDLPPFPTFTQQFFNLGMDLLDGMTELDPIIPVIFAETYDLILIPQSRRRLKTGDRFVNRIDELNFSRDCGKSLQ